jgi:hypothetical protein
MDTYVKLVPNSAVKEFIKEAQTTGKDIEVSAADTFFVRDEKTKAMVFKGMRIREDLWGLTFTKAYYPETK